MEHLDFQNSWNKLVDKCFIDGYQSLTSDERIWYNVQVLIDSVENGGLISYYYNSGADYLKETIDDLQQLKAYEIIGTLKHVNQLFPKGEPPSDIDKRNSIISSWDDDKHDGLNELFDSLDQKFFSFQEKLESKLEEVIKRVISL